MKVDNAVIMAAGTSSRFAPLSFERHKALTEVRGEVLIEREIRQLKEAGIDEIYIVTGYKAEQFEYLAISFGVHLLHNPDYLTRNNNGSIWAARKVIKNTFICSSDNYFSVNPFESEVDSSYYSAVYANGDTAEWCIAEKNGLINSVTVGGHDAWYMLGHVFWDEEFSSRFLSILAEEYEKPETRDKLWETIYIEHIKELPLHIKKYPDGEIYEFDTLDELRAFDPSYVMDTRSIILKKIAIELLAEEKDLTQIKSYKHHSATAAGFTFICRGKYYKYDYESQRLEEI